MGLRFLCIAGGAGRRNGRLHCWVCTPHRKIRIQFQGNKHTSLNLTVHESLGASALLGSENDHRNVCRKALETVVLYSGTVTEWTREQGQEVGGMSTRTASRLAWGLCVLSLALTALSLLLFILNLSHPKTHLYEPWLDNTLTAVFYPTVGAIVASRRPENPVGWLLCLYGLAISISYFCAEYAIYALLAEPNSLPAGEAMAWIVSWVLPIIIGLSAFLHLLFPTGRLPSRRWRWVAWLTGVLVLAGVISSAFSSGALMGVLGPIRNPLGVEGFTSIYTALLYIIYTVALGAVVLSVFMRLRHALGVERQQIKWFAYAAAGSVIAGGVAYLIPIVRHTTLVRADGVCTQHSLYTGDSYCYRDSDPALQALRHRPHHQPHSRLRFSHRYVGCALLRRHRCFAESVRLTHIRTYSSPQGQTLRKAARIRDLGQLGNLGTRIVLGPFEHPSPLVVDDEERDSVDRVAARNRVADEVDHDVASAGLVLIAAVVG